MEPNMTAVITSAAGSDTGLIRSGNEDSAYAGRWLFAVADGMGGHAAGEVASTTVITAIARYDGPEPPERLVTILSTAVREANDAIRHRTEDDPATRGMGTTLTAMLWSGQTFALAHIGDSRAYRLRNGQLQQLTEDHSLGNLVARAPSTLAPLISRYLDGRPDRSPDLTVREAMRGDRYLLCSDGLTSVVPHNAIHKALTSDDPPEQIVNRLIDLANSFGGPDNTTVILIDVDTGPQEITPPGMVGASAVE
jgi:PPM family protein phosphatase